jgi:glycosyltransferase involved in cell wall biosynthesis
LTRVLFLTESFHPVLGGGEGHIRELGRRLARAGLPCAVLTRGIDAAWPRDEALDGIRVVRVGPAGAGRRGKYGMVGPALAALARERHAFDVLVVRGTRILGLPGLVAARALGKAVVMQPELNGEMSGEVYTWGTRYHVPAVRRAVAAGTRARNLFVRDADAFVAMSRAIAAEFLAAGVPPEKVALMPHGVDRGRFRPATEAEKRALRGRLGLGDADLVVTYTGRLLQGKGLAALVEAFAAVAAEEPRARLVIVGSGEGQVLSVEPELKAQVASRRLEDRVRFTGRVDAVPDHLRASDVFAFPSEFEGLGISLVEAAACGLPAVGARTGGIVDVIEDGASGLLFAPGDAADLAAALRALLADAGRRAAMGRRASEIARDRFDLEDSVSRYAALFRELDGARGAGRPIEAARTGLRP